jgi:hypothetical protein
MSSQLIDLSKAKNIDWAKLGLAQGVSSDIPSALEALLSDDSELRHRGYWGLDNYVILQGDLHPSALAVIPFVIDIASADVPFGKVEAYELLVEIVNGQSEDFVKVGGVEIRLEIACKQLIWLSVFVFLKDLEFETKEVKNTILYLFASWDSPSSAVIKKLIEIQKRENDLEIKTALINVIADLKPLVED